MNLPFRGPGAVPSVPVALDGTGIITLESGSEIPMSTDHFVAQAGFAPHGSAFAYVVQMPPGRPGGGVFISPGPGQPGERVLTIVTAAGTTPLGVMPLIWASNDTIMIRDGETQRAALVVLPQP